MFCFRDEMFYEELNQFKELVIAEVLNIPFPSKKRFKSRI